MMKQVLVMVVVISLILFTASPVYADLSNTRPPEPTEGVRSTDPNRGWVDISRVSTNSIGLAANSLIYFYGCEIAPFSTGVANANGYTSLYTPQQEVRVTVYLQKWDGVRWVDLTSSNHLDRNSDYVAGGHNASISSGYYRTRAVHQVTSASLGSETTQSESSYIYID